MDPLYINIGDTVANSSVGPGKVTGFYKDFPQVNGKAVGRLVRTDGAAFGPMGQLSLPVGVAAPLVPAQVTTLGSPEMAPTPSWTAQATPPAPKQTFVPPVAVDPPKAPVTPAEIAADIAEERAAISVDGGGASDQHISVEVPTGSVEAVSPESDPPPTVEDDSPHN